jgi:hypothetical protein
MARISPEFGEKIAEALRERSWSHQRACVATGVPGATIGRMALGIVPGADHVIAWAQGIKQDINMWLVLAGYDPIPFGLLKPKPGEIVVLLKEGAETLSAQEIEQVKEIVEQVEAQRQTKAAE